jgi:OOP family OmpA-OmpF porin
MYKRAISIVLIAAAPLAAGLEAHAQQTTAGTTGFYGGLGAGRSHADIGSAGIAGSTDKEDNAWKAFGGYQFHPNFAVEGGYVDLGKASVNGTTGFGTTDTNVWQAVVVGSLPVTPQFAFTGKLGVARTETETSGSNTGVAFGGTDRETAPTYGLGMKYDFTKTFGVRGDWDRYRVSSASMGGKTDTDLYSVSAVFKF